MLNKAFGLLVVSFFQVFLAVTQLLNNKIFTSANVLVFGLEFLRVKRKSKMDNCIREPVFYPSELDCGLWIGEASRWSLSGKNEYCEHFSVCFDTVGWQQEGHSAHKNYSFQLLSLIVSWRYLAQLCVTMKIIYFKQKHDYVCLRSTCKKTSKKNVILSCHILCSFGLHMWRVNLPRVPCL